MPKFQSTADFLAQGGTVTRVPAGKSAHISTREWHRAVRGECAIISSDADQPVLDARASVVDAGSITRDALGRRVLA